MVYRRYCDNCGKEETIRNKINTISIKILPIDMFEEIYIDLCKECRRKFFEGLIKNLHGNSKHLLEKYIKRIGLK